MAMKNGPMIYLDYHATTPMDPKVKESMLACCTDTFGNPSSATHSFGWKASMLVETARKQIADKIGASTGEITWTSGATEANNMVILGRFFHALKSGVKNPHIIVSNIEHKAVLQAAQSTEDFGGEVTVLEVDQFGKINPEQVRKAIKTNTVLVSVMWANNEIGTLQDVVAIGRICHEHHVPFHTDAVQAFGRYPLNLREMPIDFLSASGHKIYGPKGVGILYARKKWRTEIRPLFFGGEQEKGLRPGTLNVAGIVGMAEATVLMFNHMDEEGHRLKNLRDHLQHNLQKAFPQILINGHPKDRLDHNLSMSFPYLSPDSLTMPLREFAISAGSACSSGSGGISYVLKAIGRTEKDAQVTLRVSLGRQTNKHDLDAFEKTLTAALKQEWKLPSEYAKLHS